MDYVYVGIGGLLGSSARYWVGGWVASRVASTFPYGTLLINVSGSFLLGLLMSLLASRSDGQAWRLFLGVGFCGGFTTFSTYAYETLRLIEQGAPGAALAYFAGGPVLALGLVVAGMALGRAL